MPVSTINRNEAVRIIKGSNGSFVTVKFRKRTGKKELRTMNCRTDVRKGTTGAGLSFDPSSKGLISVWTRRGFRFISIEGITSLRAFGKQYKVA